MGARPKDWTDLLVAAQATIDDLVIYDLSIER
jgi:hypothetical protein